MKENTNDVKLVSELSDSIQKLKKEIAKVIVGQNKVIDDLIVSLLCKGHCLLVGVPGLAKTLLIKTLAEVLDLNFSRIQFTPDLMPGDITGTEIIDEDAVSRKRSFRFIKGPLFSNLILADEINRTPPKTQAALLESMQEYKVTTAGTSYQLEQPFFVLATQNPIEQEGTYPLPEAQLDRFMFSLWLDYPSFREEVEIIKSTTGDYIPNIEKVVSKLELIKFQELIKRVPVSDNVIEHAVKLVAKTRPVISDTLDSGNLISWGAGPRASQFLILAAKAKAVIEGRFTPSIEDVNSFLVPVLRHRIIPSFNAQADGIDSVAIINKLTNAN
ncbi:AAA family ATPase [bacterium BRH_c32]|nr:MAG: AAA family ATPase [bacterium BRH_c32]